MILIRDWNEGLIQKYPNLKNCSLSIGNFESIHLGHLYLLESLNKIQTSGTNKKNMRVLLSFEPSPSSYFLKTKTRIYGIKQKIKLLSSELDFLILLRFNPFLANLAASKFLAQIKQNVFPSHISIGDDFHFGKNRLGNSKTIQKFCASNQISFYQLKTVNRNSNKTIPAIKNNQPIYQSERLSTSLVRQNLQKYNFNEVKEILGRTYLLEGKVVQGMALARKIGIPTANIRLNFEPVISGVFSAKIHLPNQSIFKLNAVCNLGIKPTIAGNQQNKFSLEVHLLETEVNKKYGALLGQIIQVEFKNFIRLEKKFSSIEALKNQIQKDILIARKQLNCN